MIPVMLSVGALVLYLAGTRRVVRQQQRGWPLRRTVWALLAAVVVAVAVSPLLHHGSPAQGHEATAVGHAATAAGQGGLWPVDGAVAHMIQHLLLGMYAPLLVVLAAPLTLTLAAAPLRWRPRLRRALHSQGAAVLMHPVVAAVPAVVGMHLLFLTPLYRLSLEHDWVHHLVQGHLLLAGTLLALALVGGDPAPPRSGLLLRLGVLVVSAGTHAHLATLVYAQAPLLPPGNPYDLAPTQHAALWMYYGGDVAELLLAGLVCLGWYHGRRRRRRTAAAQSPTGHTSTTSSGIGKSVGLPVASRAPTVIAHAASRQSAC